MPARLPGVSVHDEDIKIKKLKGREEGGRWVTFHQLVRQIDTSPQPGMGGIGGWGD